MRQKAAKGQPAMTPEPAGCRGPVAVIAGFFKASTSVDDVPGRGAVGVAMPRSMMSSPRVRLAEIRDRGRT
jgi:hypothetical protein